MPYLKHGLCGEIRPLRSDQALHEELAGPMRDNCQMVLFCDEPRCVDSGARSMWGGWN